MKIFKGFICTDENVVKEWYFINAEFKFFALHLQLQETWKRFIFKKYAHRVSWVICKSRTFKSYFVCFAVKDTCSF